MNVKFVIAMLLLLPLLAPAPAEAFDISTRTSPPVQGTPPAAAHPRPALVLSQDEDYAQPPASFRLGPQTSVNLAVQGGGDASQRGAGAPQRHALTHFYDNNQGPVSAAPAAVPALALTTPSAQRRGIGDTPAIGAVVTRQATEQLKLQGGYNWNAPGKYVTTGSQYDNGNFGPETFDPQNYKGSYSFALGAEFQQSKTLSFRGGVQYDSANPAQVALQASRQQSPRALAAVGASYVLGDGALVDLAASHVFFSDGMMGVAQRLSEDPGNDAQVQLKGKAFSHENVIKIQVRWKFK